MTNNPKDFFEEVLSDVKKLKKKHKSKKNQYFKEYSKKQIYKRNPRIKRDKSN